MCRSSRSRKVNQWLINRVDVVLSAVRKHECFKDVYCLQWFKGNHIFAPSEQFFCFLYISFENTRVCLWCETPKFVAYIWNRMHLFFWGGGVLDVCSPQMLEKKFIYDMRDTCTILLYYIKLRGTQSAITSNHQVFSISRTSFKSATNTEPF